MITTGIKTANNSSDSLLSILADPKKAETTLKKIIAENKKLTSLTKDLMKGKSVIAFCIEKEKEAEKAKSYVLQAQDTVSTEKKKFDGYKNKTTATLSKRVADVAEKEEAANVAIMTATKLQEEIEAQMSALDLKVESIAIRERKAQELKEEYTNKLNDLKDRMKGL